MKDGEKEVNLPDGRSIKATIPPDGLNYCLKIYFSGGGEKMIPGDFLKPEDVHFGFDYFVSIETYYLLEAIVQQLRLSVEDQLRTLFAVLNYAIPDDCQECVVQAEIIDKRTGQPVVNVKNQEVV